MEDLFTETFLTALIAGGVLAAVPLLFASLGEMVSEQAGVLNVGLEGMMLAGAYGGFVVALETDSTWLGLGAGMLVGALVSLVMVVLCVRMKLDQIVIGIGIVLVAEGLTSLLFDARYAASRPRLPAASEWAVPGLSELPVVGKSIFMQHPIVYVGVGLVIAAHFVLRRTSAGLSLRAAGEKPAALDAAGVDVDRTRTWATIVAGLGAGLGGAYLSVIAAGTFTPFMTQGQGFIAIVIAMLARGTAPWTIVGSLLFGMSLSVATALQLIGVQISTDYVQMLPFIAVIVVLVLFARRSYLPSALALPYVRGER
ncbi:MAG: ral nucleoside transport system permease protein [Thermoleophilaceae bacterium]|jgi:simple sugar transport system permease protein|nr:ral nucleoside transport system permease protein [Thermoleophilaceae bacterium]MEA2409158.1 ral nucleoside transport system permease protein [Thermoleophilaceae bacterium]